MKILIFRNYRSLLFRIFFVGVSTVFIGLQYFANAEENQSGLLSVQTENLQSIPQVDVNIGYDNQIPKGLKKVIIDNLPPPEMMDQWLKEQKLLRPLGADPNYNSDGSLKNSKGYDALTDGLMGNSSPRNSNQFQVEDLKKILKFEIDPSEDLKKVPPGCLLKNLSGPQLTALCQQTARLFFDQIDPLHRGHKSQEVQSIIVAGKCKYHHRVTLKAGNIDNSLLTQDDSESFSYTAVKLVKEKNALATVPIPFASFLGTLAKFCQKTITMSPSTPCSKNTQDTNHIKLTNQFPFERCLHKFSQNRIRKKSQGYQIVTPQLATPINN